MVFYFIAVFLGVASSDIQAQTDSCAMPDCDPVPSETVCNDGSDSITLSCLAGTTEVVWYNSSGVQVGTGCDLIIDNTDVGTGEAGQSECYYYEAIAADGCPGSSCCPINISVIACCVDPDPGINGTIVICPGATVTEPELFAALGGTPDEGGSWSPAAAGAGTYTYTIAGATGCPSVSAEVIVTEVGPVVLSLTSTDPSCNGDNDGAVDATIAGGTGIVTFAWSTGATSEDISGLVAGTYSLTITDENNCTAVSSATLTDPTVLSCTTMHTDVTDCDANDGTITVNGSGGTPNYNYSQDGIVFTNVNTFTGLMAGNHTVYVEDANGCISSCMATILAPTTPMCMIDNIVNITCNGAATGSFDVSGSGGNETYEFSEDNVTFNTTTSYTGLTAGSYIIYVRNLGQPSCVSMCNTLITEPDALNCVTASVDVLCFGEATGSITITATGGSGAYEYSNDGGATFQASNIFSNLTAGVYTITIRDVADNTCTHTCPAAITEPAMLQPMTSATDILCSGEATGVIDLDVTGGTLPLTYDWDIDGPDTPDDDDQDPTGLTAGTYTVTVTDANGCTVVATQIVAEPTALACSTTKTDLSANGAGDGTATVTATDGTTAYTYAWSDGQTTAMATALAAGMYTVTVTDMNDCTTTCEVVIEEPPCVQLAGEIFYDLNQNGCQDSGEALVTEGIMVSLYECGDEPGTDIPAGITMIMDGSYEFGEDSPDPGADICLEAGSSYFVVFDIPNATGEQLEDYTFTSGTADAACMTAGESNDVAPATGASECYDPDGDDDDENIDAGIVPPCEELAGEIFYDLNENGCEDAGEALVMEPITVDLYPCGSVPGVDQPVATTTVSDGEYVFGENSTDPGADICLMAGSQYFVVFDIPNGSGEALEDYVFTPAVASGTCTINGESDNVDPATGASGCYDPNDDDAGDSDDDQDIDAGIVPPCHEIAGEIFYDLNENGCEDSGEALVTEAVMVTLYECGAVPGTDVPAASTTVTDGMYEFGENSTDPGADICLSDATEYFVVFDIPNGAGEALEDYTFTSGTAEPACAAIGEADDVDPETGASECYNPNDGDGGDGADDQNIDAGIVPPCHELAGEIFYDLNENGCEDAGESLVTDPVNVSLYTCGSTPGVDMPAASTTVTDGMYEFGENSTDPGAAICLPAGTQYFVVFDIPNGAGESLEDYTFTSGVASGTCALSGESDDVDPTTGTSGCYDPDNGDGGDGDSDENIDAGIVPPCHQIAGEIFYDLNENGCEDAGESLVMEGITVSLYTCGSTPGVDIAAAITMVMDGDYVFGENSTDPGADICLDAGTSYFVHIDIPNAIGQALEEYTFTTGTAEATCEGAGESDDVNPATGETACVDPDNGDEGDGDADENLDAGIVPPCEELAGEIFYDLNENGCEDPGESLVMEPITVDLYPCGSVPGVDQPLATTTVSDGQYEFGPNSTDPGAAVCLPAGTQYFVVFDIPNGAGEALDGYVFTPAVASGTCTTSGESDNVDPTTGASACYDPNDDDPTDGNDDQDIDAGIVPPCHELAGEIFYDLNENGCEDAGESLVTTAVTVALYECGAVPGTDAPAAMTVVNDGTYEFGENSTDSGADICLENGSQYFVVFDIPNGAGEVLEDYSFTTGTASAGCAATGEADDVDPATGQSACYDPNDMDPGDGADDESIDAGIVPPCESIAGEIFYDNNENGCQDAGETLVTEAIDVLLYECGDTPGTTPPFASTTVTDGTYEFSDMSTDPGAAVCLDAGTQYFVVFDIPSAAGEALQDYTFTSGAASGACQAAGESDDVNPTTGASACYDPDGSDDDENVDAGIVPPCHEIAGEIFYDLNENGCEDPGESLVMTAVTVSLYTCGSPLTSPPAASTTITDGTYSFSENSTDPGAAICLDAGTSYFVVFDIPNAAGEVLQDYTFSSGTANTACASAGESDDVGSTGASACYDPDNGDAGDGDSDQNIDAGIVPPCHELAGEIFYDLNENGCEDAGETLVTEMVTVDLYPCGSIPGVDQPLATTTITDGTYEFGENSTDPGADICLPAGQQYFVAFSIPNGPGGALEDYTFTTGVATGSCTTSGESNNVDPATGASTCYDPDNGDAGDGDDDQDIDAGIVPPCESMAGEIFYDINENGCQDSAEPLVTEAVTVTLFECGATPGVDAPAASTTITDGTYEFGEGSPDPGAAVCLDGMTDYFVVFDIPNAAGQALEDHTFSTGTASATCEALGESDDVNPADGASNCYDPSGDDDDNNIDAGIVPPCESLGGEIFYDNNENGCQDGAETLVVAPVTVTLYACGSTPGVDAPAAMTTVTDGDYMFGEGSMDPGADICLDAGTSYFVVFDIPNGTGQALEDFAFTTGMATTTCFASGGADDVNPATGGSSCYDPDGSDDDEHVDAGIVAPCESMAGEIFYDGNDNGCQESTETLVTELVTVSLYTCGTVPGVDAPYASTVVTDGDYVFGTNSPDPGANVCLMPGRQYFVVFDIPNGAGETLEDYTFSSGTASPGCEFVGESDDVDPATGASACYDPNNDDAGDGSSDENIDAGIVPPCEQLAGEIFYDDNNNGCEDPGETLVMEAVNVTLYNCGDVPGLDQPVAATTVTDGDYVFGDTSPDPGANVCLEPGTSYFVVFDIPNGTGQALEDYYFSTGTANSACLVAGEGDNVDPTNGHSTCYDPDNSDPGDGDGDEDIDAGIMHPCQDMAGEIFYDLNNNGCEDAGEGLVMESVGVSLYNCGDTPGVNPPLAMTTVADGEYLFGENSTDPGAAVCLNPRFSYFVVFDLPIDAGQALEDYKLSTNSAGASCAAAGESDDVDPLTATSACYNSNDDDDDMDIDVGLYPCEEISGVVFYDNDDNGCEDGTDGPVSETVNVTLYACSGGVATGGPLATTTTINGAYNFGVDSPNAGAAVCLDPAVEYMVVFDIPNGVGESLEDYVFSTSQASSACEAGGSSDDVDPSTGGSACYNPSGDDDDSNIDAGIVPPYFDLMLVKQLAAGQSDMVQAGDQVIFELVITNLSSPLADNIVVNDMIPNGLSFDPALNPFWTETGGTATTTLTVAGGDLPTGGLAENQSVTISILLTVNHNVPQGVVMDNIATIAGNDDNPSNDTDNEKVSTPITDLGIVKSLAAGQVPTVDPGGQVTYNITVTNNGTTYIGSAYLTDEYPFTYMTLNDANWIPGMTDGFAAHTAFVDLDPGESYTIPITFDVSMYSPGMTLINKAHITMIFDGNNDPMSDSDASNDWDDEPIGVANSLVYDMSLSKNISGNTPYPHFFGSAIEFDVEVCNEGNTQISNFLIEDVLGPGFQFITGHAGNAGWTMSGGSTYQYTIPSLQMNSCTTLKMYCTVLNNGGPWDNDAEIVSATTPIGTPITPTLDLSGFQNNLEGLEIEPMAPMGVIGSCVFKDLNGNGVRDAGEAGIPSIRVELYNGAGVLQSITMTDAVGSYMFMDLFAGSYYVKFILADGYTFTAANQGNNDNNDSDVDGSNGPATTAIINLGNNEMDISIYAGLYRCIPFGDLIWFDVNGNNRQEANENGINGVRVEVFRNTNGTWVKYRTVYSGHKPGTPSDDGYWKTCLPPGQYYVKYNVPSSLKAAVPMVGGITQDSDVTGAFGDNTTNSVQLVSCTENCHVDAGYTNTSGFIANDSGPITKIEIPVSDMSALGTRKGSYNLLAWKEIGTEIQNVSYYQISKLIEGEYQQIGKILGDESMNEFTYRDYDDLQSGLHQYRIDQIGLDQQIINSEKVEVEVLPEIVEVNIYPNPVSDNLSIELNLTRVVEKAHILIYDNGGAKIQNLELLDFDIDRGQRQYSMDVSGLAAGVYNLRIDLDGEILTKRMIVVNK